MTEANQTAENYLYDVMNLFSIRYEDGSRLPATMREVEGARELLEKAREAKPDDPEIVKWLEEMETLVAEAPKRKWRGSLLMIIVCAIFIFGSFERGDIAKVKNMFTWPEISKIEFNIKRDITNMARTFAAIEGMPDTDPNKARRLKAANERLEELRNLDPATVRKEAISKHLSEGFWAIFFMVYFVGLTILYIYSVRTPQYLLWKRQRELQFLKNSRNIFGKLIWGISRLFFFMGKISFKLLSFSSGYRTAGSRYSPRISHGSDGFMEGTVAALFFFFLGIFFLVFVFVFFANLIAQTLWLIVLILYVRNYHHDRIETGKRWLKEKYAQWREKRGGGITNDNLALEESPPAEN